MKAIYDASDNVLIREDGQKIPVSEMCQHLCKDGEVYEVDKHYLGVSSGRVAVPLDPPKGEDELWKEVIEYVDGVEWIKNIDKMIDKLKAKYIITKKQ